MAISVTHALQTTVPESTGSGGASGIIGPTEWNAQHVITGMLDTPISATVTTSSYTFLSADSNAYIPFSASGAQNATIPQSTFSIGVQLTVEQAGVGQLTVIAGAGVTLLPASSINTLGRYAVVGFIQRSLNTWVAFGNKF